MTILKIVDRHSERLIPIMLLLCVGVVGGLFFSFNRIATVAGVPYIPYVSLSCGLSGIALLLIGLPRGGMPGLTWPHIRSYLILGIFGMAVPVSVLAFVAPKVPASVLALGQALVPTMTYILALGIRMESFRWLRIGGIGLGLIGVLLVVVPNASLPNPEMASWVLVALFAPLCFAITGVLAMRIRPPNARSVEMAAGVQIVAALFLIPVMAIADSWWFFGIEWGDGELAMLGVSTIYVIFWFCFFEVIRLAGPVFFSTSNYLVTISGVLWGLVIFGTILSYWVWLALVAVLASLYLMNRR